MIYESKNHSHFSIIPNYVLTEFLFPTPAALVWEFWFANAQRYTRMIQ